MSIQTAGSMMKMKKREQTFCHIDIDVEKSDIFAYPSGTHVTFDRRRQTTTNSIMIFAFMITSSSEQLPSSSGRTTRHADVANGDRHYHLPSS